MNRRSRTSKGKQINPTFFVFCEGETEKQYINFLRSKYRLPIEMEAKIAGNRITEIYISNFKKGKVNHPKDKTYLIYDLDAPKMLEKLQTIRNTVLLSSNPCFELWYLFHYQEQNAHISCVECNQKMVSHHKSYLKGVFDSKLKEQLNEKQEKAIHRASKLSLYQNPSSQVFKLINELEDVKKLNLSLPRYDKKK